MKSVLLIRDN